MKNQKGQVVLITLLALSLAVTVALSLISRSTTDQALTSQLEQSAKAFSAAEAGVEQALKTSQGTNGVAQVLTSGSQFQTTVADIGGASSIFEYPRITKASTTETLWLVNHNADGTLNETPTYTAASLDVCWNGTTTPALLVTAVFKRGTSYMVAKGAYDPDGTRAATNGFSGVTATTNGCGQTSMNHRVINFAADMGITPATDTLLMLRLRPVYADAKILVNPNGVVLPLQGKQVISTGSTTSGATRKIIVSSQYRSASSIFDAALYSQGNLIK